MGEKLKRGARGSTEDEGSNSKRLNMAEANTTEAMVAGSDDEASNFTHDGEHAASDNDEPSLYEIRSMLVEIQITVSGIQRQNNQLVEEMVVLRNTVKLQKRELDATKCALEKVKTQNRELQRELEDVREKAAEREMEIEELYDLQDALEQYTRKQSLEIHGIPESAYTSTEDAVLKVAQALDHRR